MSTYSFLVWTRLVDMPTATAGMRTMITNPHSVAGVPLRP